MLFSRYKVAYEGKRRIMRNVASVVELTKSFFGEIDKVENREGVEKLRVNIWVARKGFSWQLCVRSHRFGNSPYEARALSNI